ncbi:MAG: type II toxin-antitoxin system RelE/ParE family toxin [Verrucomicrobia bacterium]|nr:type II toxin-antitoxin system RelE/ParE family toxin [Verrucomicrobiota bacterium]
MRIVVLPQAADEFDDATANYEDRQAGLGRRFRDEVDHHIGWIVEHADVPRLRSGGYRRVNLKAFPYYVAYLRTGETVWILAIAHGHREPEYWIDRRQNISQQSAPGNAG